MKRVVTMLALTWLVTPAYTFCQSYTTISYDGTVTDTFGPNEGAFSLGDQVVISYTLDPSVLDSDSNPNVGRYFGAVRSISVSFPGLGISAVAGASGLATVFNNSLSPVGGTWSDQAGFIGGPISSTTLLGGAPITRIEVGFLTAFLVPPTEPTMLSSDALPLVRLVPGQGSGATAVVLLRTSAFSSSTFVSFDISLTPEEQIGSLLGSIESLATRGELKDGQAKGLMRPLENALRSLARGQVVSACSQIGDFESEVNQKLLDGALSAADATSLIQAADGIRSDMGC